MEGSERLTRNAFLRRSGAAGAALLGGSLWATGPVAARARRARPADPQPRHLLPGEPLLRPLLRLRAGGAAPRLRPAAGYSQPDAAGTQHPVFHQTARAARDPNHSWAGTHLQHDGGRMDGFYRSSGDVAIGYYTAQELPFYYGLFDDPEAALCPTYFASVLGLERAEPPVHDRRDVRRDHDQRPVLPGGPRRRAVAPHLRPARRGRGHVENLQPARRRRPPHGRERQLGDLLDAVGRGPAHVRHAGGLPARLPRRHAARRLVGAVGRARRARRAPARGRGDRDGAPAADHRRAARVAAVAARGVPAHLRRARRLLRPRGRRRRSTRSASASGCRCG